jgi:sugar O-acyltransferase (sialic acid O-acetyltransferase NeuD family)
MPTRLIIAGAGGHGREVFAWTTGSPRFLHELDIEAVVFINDEPPKVEPGAPIVGTIRDAVLAPDDLVISGIGDPRDRQSIVVALSARGARFATFVHDEAILGPRVNLGCGAVVFPRVTISTDVSIGAHVHVNTGALVHHDVTVGDFAMIAPGAMLLGGSALGTGAYLGAGAVVLPGCLIGDGAVVGSGAVVTADVAPATVVAGVPARRLR